MTYEVCIVCVRTPARVQSTVISAAYCLQLARAAAILVTRNTYIESYGKTHKGYIYIILYTDTLTVLLVHVGLAQARPNYIDSY